MPKLMEKTFLVGLGAVSLVGKRIKKTIDELSEKGRAARDEIAETTRKLEEKGTAKVESLRASFCPKCCTSGQNRPTTRQDIERLEQKLEELKQTS
ncbi:MAG: hypothetical protein A4E52_00347 [Pelotomaculum sp. PtaB.Bin013]|uniref:Uncharacterized protein n=1 Tax=Pelotomaculum isophthalicicum JI TaxID=947010 RepID=A0A9X4H2N6_9FIRM|nr:hypothetical protein [Pelotomaculum isophthalicicum]MDF9409000.1 hypothetical protein [Pelotomaculum isophthalicicum JI]OPX91774.1 MAG: hypothetical protein A4E52_00347 [Pelotomaculum sp. PtaB.Bin013]